MEQVPKFNTENYEDHRKFRKLDIIFVNTQVVQCSERSTMKVRKVHLEKRQTTWHECTTTIVGLRYVNPFKRGLYSMQDPIVQVAASQLASLWPQLGRQFSGSYTHCSISQKMLNLIMINELGISFSFRDFNVNNNIFPALLLM